MLNNRKTILVTGAHGQLGMEFREIAAGYPLFQFLFTGKDELSIDNREAVAAFFGANKIDYCINCAAYTAVDKAEAEQEAALTINAAAPGYLAEYCKKHDAVFIHFSTDYVFNGNAAKPYQPSDPTDPVNFYGLTKLKGEASAQEKHDQSIIIRTSWVYSSFGKNFVKTMLRLMAERSSIGVVSDQQGSPTYAADLAKAVMQIVQSAQPKPGIYHYCNDGIISWYDFATAIKELSGSSCVVNPILTKDYPTPAKRPAYSALNTHKIQSVYSIDIPQWKESLKRCLQQL